MYKPTGTWTVQGIVLEVLKPIAYIYDTGGTGFFLVQENAWSDMAKVSRQLLDDEGTGAPDLNPIKNLWNILFQCISFCQTVSRTHQWHTDALIKI